MTEGGSRERPGLGAFCLAAGVAVLAVHAAVAGDDGLFASLARAGYAPEAYRILSSWTECVPQGPPLRVTGCRLAPLDGGPEEDVYVCDGQVLSDSRRQELGIARKDWTQRIVSAPPEITAVSVNPPTIPVPVGVREKAGFSVSILLPEPDLQAVAKEDAAARTPGEKGIQRIGIFRDLPAPLEADGKRTTMDGWAALSDGSWLWSAVIQSPGAVGLRIEFLDLDLPGPGTLLVYNAAAPGEVYGPITGTDVQWSPTCFGDTVAVECHIPAGVDPSTAHFRIGRIAHVYVDLWSREWSRATAGSCNLDLACYPDWAETARGVGGLGTIGLTGVVWCTGSLIVDLDPCTQVPYLLTANHCIGTDQKANTVEVYWLYQKPVCSGTMPPAASVPRTTGGADRVAYQGGDGNSGLGNDFCLLRLRNAPPPGLTVLGWTTEDPPLSTGVSCIHHPRGDYKRISFGHLSNTANSYPEYFHEVSWDQGTTEPGSSGSPLMRSLDHVILGQLWGGDASCSTPTLPDFYGRFQLTYPIIEGYLLSQTSVHFESAEITFQESAGTKPIRVLVAPAAPAAGVTVTCTITGGSAVSGTDFDAHAAVLQFSQGESEKELPVTLLDDIRHESDETFTVTLSQPTCARVFDGEGTLTVHIADNDPDSDGDTLSDQEESSGYYGVITNPHDADTDGDGLRDAEELFGYRGYVTNPAARDTDGDGAPDLTEYILHMNPVDPEDGDELPLLSIPWFQTSGQGN